MQKNTYIPLAKIPENLDIKQGDIVLIASDITRLAFGALRHEKRFDAKQLINAFQKKLGAEGTLLFLHIHFIIQMEQRLILCVRSRLPGR